jgi:hypothetical protein
MSSRRKIEQISHPAYNSDLTPSDFFPFASIKRKPTEYYVLERQSLKSAIIHIFDEIEQETLIAVFETWINGLGCVIEHEGKYFHQ